MSINYAYQWKRNGTNIAGATGSSYPLVTADLDANITVTVTATNGAGNASATSIAVGPITAASSSVLTCQVGAFALAGESMEIVTDYAGYAMQAGVGAFALAGKDATLIMPYTGPGEITGWDTAYGYWGLRAYNTSKIGANCIDVCANINGAAVNLTTVVIGSDGYADLSGIGFGPTIYINRIYDQSGSQDIFFNSGFERPVLAASMVGGKPAMFFDGSCWGMTSGNATALAQIVNVAAVVRAATFTFNARILTDGTVNFQPMSIAGVAQVGQYLGVFPDNHPSVPDNTFGSIISVCANSAGGIYVNGVNAPATGNVGPNGIGTTNKLTMGATADGGGPFTGYIYEIMIKGGSISATNIGLLNTNHHAIGSGWV
jgi:hypothetical protein